MKLNRMDYIYDEEFSTDLLLARSLINQLHEAEDREICRKWIKKLCSLKSTETLVKKNRNVFFKYLLKVIRNGTLEAHHPNVLPHIDDHGRHGKKLEKKDEFTSYWAADRRTYVATKSLPGKGALIYMAVSKDPDIGWDFPYKTR